MTSKKWIAAIAALCGSAVLIYAHAEGPDPRHTGAPGDDPLACTSSGCHETTPLNKGGGNVAVNVPSTYTPGQTYTFQIVITDSVAKAWGFQMSARLGSDQVNGQAGLFVPDPAQQIVICDDSSLATATGCPSAYPVEFIEHDMPYTTNTISVQWTAPATNVGNVYIYVAANAASGDIEAQPAGDHIYTAHYMMSPACTDSTPTISTVQSAASFNPKAGLASGTWLEIFGKNLSCNAGYLWSGSDFKGNNAPTSLQGVTVTIDGIDAVLDYVSPTQVNVQAPDDPKTGAGIQVVVTNAAGSSNGFSMQKNAIAPALLAPTSFDVGGHQWVVAQHQNGTYVGKAGLIKGVTFSPAKAGEVITIYGIGFGPVNPAVPSGTITPASNTVTGAVHFLFGETQAKFQYDGLAQGFVGLYQFNVTVPTVTAGDMPLNADVGGVSLGQNLYITVQ